VGGFGEKLRREREMRGITLEEIAEATKIGSRSLTALETEDFDKLPGGIFNKGFVRSYARYLGIDEDQAVADFLSAEAIFRKGGPAPSVSVPTGDDGTAGAAKRFSAAPVAVILVLALAGYAGWRVISARRAPRTDSPSHAATSQSGTLPRSGTANAAATPAAPDPASSAPASANPSTAAAAAAAGNPASQQGSAASSPQTAPIAASPAVTLAAQAGASNPAASSTAAAAGEAFTIRVRAREEAWVSLTVDGKPIPSSLLKPGEERQVEAHRRVILKTGNAGGVDVTLNGKPLALDAKPNEVKTLVFNSQGIEQ
jgi:cytoskeleton protein RodZ